MDQASLISVELSSEVLSDLLLFVISDRRALKSACLKLYATLGICRLLHPTSKKKESKYKSKESKHKHMLTRY